MHPQLTRIEANVAQYGALLGEGRRVEEVQVIGLSGDNHPIKQTALPISIAYQHSFVLRQQLSNRAARKEFETLRQPLNQSRSAAAKPDQRRVMHNAVELLEYLKRWPSQQMLFITGADGREYRQHQSAPEDRVHWLLRQHLSQRLPRTGGLQSAREFAQFAQAERNTQRAAIQIAPGSDKRPAIARQTPATKPGTLIAPTAGCISIDLVGIDPHFIGQRQYAGPGLTAHDPQRHIYQTALNGQGVRVHTMVRLRLENRNFVPLSTQTVGRSQTSHATANDCDIKAHRK